MLNNGYYNELKLIEMLNGKQCYQLEEKMQKIITLIFEGETGKIKAEKCQFRRKPDIFLEINGNKKFISIKSGNSNSLHFEGIKDFVLFLRDMGISRQTQKTILLFQYGDGTMDGTGKTRLNHNQLMSAMKNEIETANAELNRPDLIRKCVERVFFNGGYNNKEALVDYVLYIDNDDYYLASQEKIVEAALVNNYSYINTLHIGPIIIYPYLRDTERKSKKEYKRNIVHCKWINLKQTIKEISIKNN